jgi:ribonuclease HI
VIQEETMKLKGVRVYIDGACRDNPGPSAIGILVCTVTDKVLKEHSEAIGEHTNNESEYTALIRGLELASEYTKGKAEVFLNSTLVAKQSSGEYRVKEARLLPLRDKVVRLAREFEDVDLCIIPRDDKMLVRADALANRALDRKH